MTIGARREPKDPISDAALIYTVGVLLNREGGMDVERQSSSVLVGIDGSDAAVGAARWAVEEAVSRAVPLVLVSVMKARHASADDYDRDLHHAQASLEAARAAIESTGRSVKVETEIGTGEAAALLVARSRDAELVCVGSVGVGRFARSVLGSTATEVAEGAHCPVAVIRPDGSPTAGGIRWMVASTGISDEDPVVDCALQEARLRQLPVLLLRGRPRGGAKRAELDRCVARWKERFPGLHIYPVFTRKDVALFIREHSEPVEVAVVGPAIPLSWRRYSAERIGPCCPGVAHQYLSSGADRD